jgi:hypothetical protein
MRKITFSLLVIGLTIMLFGHSFADTSSNTTADATASVDDHSISISNDKRPLVQPFVNPQFALTPYFGAQKGKWFLYWSPVDSVFSIETMKNTKKTYNFGEIITGKWLKRHVRVSARRCLEKNERPIKLMKWDPFTFGFHPEDEKIGEAVFKNRYSYGPWPFDQFITQVLYEAKMETMTSRVFAFVRLNDKAVAKASAIASAISAAEALRRGTFADNASGGVSVAPMIGTTTLEIEEVEDIKIICMNDGKEEPPDRKPPEESETDKLKKYVEKRRLQVEREKLDKELKELQAATSAAPQPPPSKPEPKKIEPSRASLLFDIDDYMPNKGRNTEENYRQGEMMINWLLANESEVRKQGGKIALIGGCDERLIDMLKKTSEKYANNLKSLTGANSNLAALHPYPTDKDYVNPLLGERRARLAKVFLGVVAKRMGVLEKVQPLLKNLPVLSSAKDWLAVPDRPLDDKNRYAMLAVVIGGPEGK